MPIAMIANAMSFEFFFLAKFSRNISRNVEITMVNVENALSILSLNSDAIGFED